MIRWIGAILFFVGFAFAEADSLPDSVITSFPDKISVQFLARYNYASFSGASTDDETLQTNRPIDLGLGGGYGDFTWSTLFTFSFGSDNSKPRTQATNLQFNYFGDRFFGDLYLKVNDGFYYHNDSLDEFVSYKLRIIEIGLDANYLWNKEHSLRAVYSLDRRQWKHNGSFICGFGVYYHGIVSQDSALAFYKDYQGFLHAGPNVGVSRIWAWKNGFFFNVMIVGTVSLGMNMTRKEWMQFYQVFPKFAVGYHSDTWSVTFPFYVSVLLLNENDGEINDTFFEGSGGFMVTKRF